MNPFKGVFNTMGLRIGKGYQAIFDTDSLITEDRIIELVDARMKMLSESQANGLTGSADTTLHYHSADRGRANHTGTQALSTIHDAGGAAALNVGTGAGTVAGGDDSRFLTTAQKIIATQPASSTNSGYVTTTTQLFSGTKAFKDVVSLSGTEARYTFSEDSTGANGWFGIPSWNKDALYLYGPTPTGTEPAFVYEQEMWRFFTAGLERLRVDSDGNLGVGMSAFGGGESIVAIKDAVTAPGNPSGGGFLYCEGGALKYRGSSGTVTTIASA